MTVLESLGVDAFGFSIVFVVLIALSLVIKITSKIVSAMQKKVSVKENKQPEVKSISQPTVQSAQYADGELRLFDVDEKTAALIMAIVSDESQIPLTQLQFKSIRLMKQEVK